MICLGLRANRSESRLDVWGASCSGCGYVNLRVKKQESQPSQSNMEKSFCRRSNLGVRRGHA